MEDTRIIRSATPEDFDRWAPLWEGYNRFYERVAPAEVTHVTWRRFFDAYEPMHALVAERDGALIGLAHYLFHRNTAMLGPTCYLQDLFTAPAARGAGVGRALIEAVYERARVAGSTRVYWMTQETNHAARVLYDAVAERSGFIQYRRQL
ncbi:MAG: GNAT family N-acetyltransferase [Hyphomonadaceae bacterium]|nr:GNAT family N-acetyltransferase [Hyphomonadaceae bacterium]